MALDGNSIPKPEITQASGYNLDLRSFQGDPVITVKKWPSMAKDQKVWLAVEGVTTDGLPASIALWTSAKVVERELDYGLSKPIPRSELERFSNGPVTVRLRVADVGGSEASAIAAPLAEFMLTKSPSGRNLIME